MSGGMINIIVKMLIFAVLFVYLHANYQYMNN